MAHQAHAIPWGVLSSNFKFTSKSARHGDETNLFPRKNPAQGKELMYFAHGFAQAVESMSRTERENYPSSYDVTGSNDLLIDDVTESKIRNTVRRYRMATTRGKQRGYCPSPCPVTYMHGCTCPLSPVDRSILPWKLEDNLNQCVEYPSPHHDSTELFKTLLLHGQIDALLRIAAQPSASIEIIWASVCCRGQIGWGELMRSTLMSYICLNVSFLKPETYDATARAAYLKEEHRNPPTKPEDLDYRKAEGYERMLKRCTARAAYSVHLYPHQEFFGVGPDGSVDQNWRDSNPTMPVLETHYLHEYMPLRSDIPVVTRYLQQKGLPLELALEVLDHAEYIPRRRLPIADDPLHPENSEELRKYLKYCWKLLVWCNVVAEGTGKKINWVYEITQCILDLWGVDELKRRTIHYYVIDREYLQLPRVDRYSFI